MEGWIREQRGKSPFFWPRRGGPATARIHGDFLQGAAGHFFSERANEEDFERGF